jgi:hypothetical protein
MVAGIVTVPARAADEQHSEASDVSQIRGWGDPAMAEIAVNSGRALVNHLRSAGALLDEGQAAQARSALIASREFADAIERTMPYLLVVEEMRDTGDRVVQENVEALAADFLPIYAGLDELAVYAPEVARKTRGMVKQAEKHAAGGDKKRAAGMLQEAAAVVTEHTVYLPVEYVDRQVRAALYAVNQSKPDLMAAKAAVGRALDSLTTVVDAVVTAPVK